MAISVSMQKQVQPWTQAHLPIKLAVSGRFSACPGLGSSTSETAGTFLALELLLLAAHCYNHTGMNNTDQEAWLYGFEDSVLWESLSQITSRIKATAGTDIFCQSTHGFAAGKGLWLPQRHNDLQRADCWQGTDVILTKTGQTKKARQNGFHEWSWDRWIFQKGGRKIIAFYIMKKN